MYFTSLKFPKVGGFHYRRRKNGLRDRPESGNSSENVSPKSLFYIPDGVKPARHQESIRFTRGQDSGERADREKVNIALRFQREFHFLDNLGGSFCDACSANHPPSEILKR